MTTGTLRIVAHTREEAQALIVYLATAAASPGVEVKFLPPHRGHRDGEWLAYATVTIEEHVRQEVPVDDDEF